MRRVRRRAAPTGEHQPDGHHPVAAHEGDRFTLIELGSGREAVLELVRAGCGDVETNDYGCVVVSSTAWVRVAAPAMWAKEDVMAAAAPKLEKPNVVLVHGAFADGSGWEAVYRILKGAGCTVAVVQNPTVSLEDDVAATKLVIAAQDGPVVLVAHSYGGVVITEAGTDPNVAGLVYIAAFAPDAGESVNSLIADPPPGAPVAPLAPQDGFLFLDKEKFPAAFAADVDAEHAAFMADSQVPWGVGALTGEIGEPAWKSRPSWWLIATDDLIIPPDAQRLMSKRAGSSVVETEGNHAIYVSNPTAVAELIQTAIAELRSAS